MICRNCNYILSGSEQFCPNCGNSLQQSTDNTPNSSQALKPPIFTSEKIWNENEVNNNQNKIFMQSDEPDYPETKSGKGKKTVVILSLLILLAVLCSTAFFMFEKIDISPVISAIIPSKESQSETQQSTIPALVTTATSQVNKNFGVISPEIIYKPVNCYISGNAPLQLKKGPDNAYGLVVNLTVGQQVQIIGGSVLSNDWYYVYLPAEDCYGWINGAYLSESETIEQVIVNSTTNENEEGTTLQETENFETTEY